MELEKQRGCGEPRKGCAKSVRSGSVPLEFRIHALWDLFRKFVAEYKPLVGVEKLCGRRQHGSELSFDLGV